MTFDIESFDEKKDKDVMIMYINTWGTLKSERAIEILKEKLKSEDYDIAKAAADALKQITGKDYIKDIKASKITNDFDWNFIDKLNNKKLQIYLLIRKYKNRIIPDIAPFTISKLC
jgi:hypothetical protein